MPHRAVVKNSKGEVFKGDWSRNMTQPNFCEGEYQIVSYGEQVAIGQKDLKEPSYYSCCKK